jgi:hypothetical protein
VDVSAPAFSSAIAAVWRSTCMETRFERSVGQPRWAVATCLARRRSVPRVSGPPWREGNRAQVGLVPGLAHPDPEHRDALAGQWRDALLSSFADRAHVRAGAEVDIGVGQREQLGDAQTGLHGRGPWAGPRRTGAGLGVVQRSPVGAASSAVETGCPAGMASAPPAASGWIVWASWPPPTCTRRGLAASATGIVSVSTPCS